MTDAEWRELRFRDDPSGMTAFATMCTQNGQQNRIHLLHEIDALDDGVAKPLPVDLPFAVRELFMDTAIPQWLTEFGHVEQLQTTACNVFHQDIVGFVLALLCKSLPECYAGANGAKVLAYTGALGEPNYSNPHTQNTMIRRVVETAVFVRNVHRREMWEGTDPIALRTIHKVRLFHCGVRMMIEQHSRDGIAQWNTEQLGIPINQQDMLATNLAFALQSMRGAAKLGVRISAHERHAILVHWARIGHHLGIDQSLLREFIVSPEDLWDRVVRDEFRASPQGHVLTSAMVSFLQQKVFSTFQSSHLPELLMRKLMDKEAVTAVQLANIPPSNSNRVLLVLQAALILIHDLIISIPIVGKYMLNRIGADIVDITITAWAGERNPHITLSSELETI